LDEIGAIFLSQSRSVVSAKPIIFQHSNENRSIHNEYRQDEKPLVYLPLAPLTATFTTSSMVDEPSTSSFFFKESGKAWKGDKQDRVLKKESQPVV